MHRCTLPQPDAPASVTAVPWRGRLAALATGLLMAPLAQGFESSEHREMSEMAVAVVQQMAGQGQRIQALPGAIDALNQLQTPGPDGQVAIKDKEKQDAYGQITKCVDFFMFPEKILAYGWKLPPPPAVVASAAAPADAAASAPPERGGVPDAQHPVWPELLDQCKEQGAAAIQASHNNHAHFQQDLMMSLRLWHLMAVSVAKAEENPYGGLLVNAMADHYLQDFFAPGHQVTPRERLTDLPATATHDLANEMGALFYPTLPCEDTPGTAWDKTPALTRVLKFLCGQKSVGAETACQPTAAILNLLDSPKRSLNIATARDELVALRQGLPVLLRGDGQLAGAAQARQRMLMLVVQAAGIVDVLEGENRLKQFAFAFDRHNGQPQAATDFGRYEFSAAGTAIAQALARPPKAQPAAGETLVAARAIEGQSLRFSPCSLGRCPGTFYALNTRSPVFSLALQRESHSNGAFHARSTASVEVATVDWLWDVSKLSGNKLAALELSPVLGYTYYREDRFSGNGPSLRLAMSVPETEFSVSAFTRYLSYPGADNTPRRLSYGLRADAGFSSYFTFFVTGGIDYGVNASGALSKGRIWGGGLRIGLPLSRVPHGGGDGKP